jgi:TRAP-type mannitol/chloroaromatic compound transport system permease small subunit
VRALARFVGFVDKLMETIGRGVAWLTLAMVLTTFLVVVLRYGFALGWVWMQETYVWLHGIVFMIGAGYTLLHDDHVRVDIFYRPANPRHKALVNLLGVFVLLLPVLAIVAYVAWPYVIESWSKLEGSREAGGLPGLFLLKTMILGFCALVALQGLALAARGILILAGRAEFAPVEVDREVV